MEIQKKEGVRAKGGEGGRGREKLMLDFENSLRFILHTQGHCVYAGLQLSPVSILGTFTQSLSIPFPSSLSL